jgi:oxygen-dependent protoporphyrinogen oxidase
MARSGTPSTPAALPALILGGGMAGLLAAWHLRRRGVAAQIWEAGDAPGGWVRTVAWEEGAAELGPQSLPWRPGDAADRLLRALDLPWDEVPRRARWAALDGRLVPVPAHGGAFLASPLLSPAGRLRMLAGLLWPRPPREDEDLAAWTRRRFGAEAAERLLPLAARGLFATGAEALDASVLRRPRTRQVRPPGGMGALAAALAKDVDLHLGLRARRIEPVPGGWRVSGEGHEATAERVLLALPAFEAAGLLKALAPVASAALDAIPYASVETWHSRHAPGTAVDGGHGFLVHPREGSDLLGCTVLHDGAPGLRLRSFLPLGTRPWSDVEAALRPWIPDLGHASATLRLEAPRALAAPPPGQRARVARILKALPPGLEWLAAARFGQGLGPLIAALETWPTEAGASRV